MQRASHQKALVAQEEALVAQEEALVAQQDRERAAILFKVQTDAWAQHTAWHAQKAVRKVFIAESLECYVRTGVLPMMGDDDAHRDTCIFCGEGELRWTSSITNNMPPPILIKPTHIVFPGSQVPPLDVVAHLQCVHLLRSHWGVFRPVYIDELRARLVEVGQEVANLPRALIDYVLLPCLHEFSTHDARYRAHMHVDS